MDFEEKHDIEQRLTETKAERRIRRKKEMDRILRDEEFLKMDFSRNHIYEAKHERGYGNIISAHENEILHLLGKAKERGYTNEEIGKEFRKIFSIF